MTAEITLPKSVKIAHAVLGCMAAIATVSVVVYGSARAGVEAAVREEISAQIENGASPLNRQINATINQHEADICEPRWREVQDHLHMLNIAQATVDTKIDILLERSGTP